MASQIQHNTGSQFIAGILNGSITKGTNLYLLLRQLDGTSGRPADAAAADTLSSSLSEVPTSGTGYARIAVPWSSCTIAAVGNTWVITVPQQTFNFTGSCTATHSSIATSSDASGYLLCSAPLSATRNFANGDQDNCTFKWVIEQGS